MTAKFSRSSLHIVATGLAMALQSGTALAEPPFPAALQEAAGLECAPQCTLCHTDPNGGATTWVGKKVGAAVGASGFIHKGSGAEDIKKAYNSILDKAKMNDANALLVVNSLQAGLDPDTGQKLCQITYGCGAHVAKSAPRNDWSGLLFVAGAMLFGAILRRGKARSAAS